MASPNASNNQGTGIIVIGMAGSGKTSFMEKLDEVCEEKDIDTYQINLDPAVGNVQFDARIDIQDTVDYKKVMNEYKLGPNGAILTSLNLFATKFDQVVNIIEERSKSSKYIMVDTPGQIEIFTWSASGAIITDAIASVVPTVIAYVIDTPRTQSPTTFMSNMLYACSILYKTRLPFVIVFNKTDVTPCDQAESWMRDYQKFQEALMEKRKSEGESGGYMDSLMNSMCLVLDEFYQQLRAVGVSSVTGDGIDNFFKAVEEARQEYIKEYKPVLDEKRRERDATDAMRKETEMTKLMKDLDVNDQNAQYKKAPDEIDSDSDENSDGNDDDELYGDEADVLDRYDVSPYPQINLPDVRRMAPDETVWPAPR